MIVMSQGNGIAILVIIWFIDSQALGPEGTIMICRAAAREACLMIPPSSPAFLAERQSIFAQREIQSELESIQCCRIYITSRHPVPA